MINFTLEVDINKSRDDVALLFHPDHLVNWSPDFAEVKHISGPLGEAGSKYEWYHKVGGTTIKITETFVTRDLPESFSCIFDEAKSIQTSVNWLKVLPNNRTLWVSDQCVKGKNLFMTVFIKCMPWVFKGYVKKNMMLFKAFAEEYQIK